MNAGDRISFVTHGGTVVNDGQILSNDVYLSLPLRVEYWTDAGDKRIERFNPVEFKGGYYDVT